MAYAYISGSITYMPIEWLDIYENIAKVVNGFGMEAYIPHIQTPKSVNSSIEHIKNSADGDGFHKGIFQNDVSKVENSSLVIAEVSNPSTGVGIELGVAFKTGKPVIFLAQEKSRVTPLVLGAVQSGLANLIRYDSEEDALHKLKDLLEKEFKQMVMK